MEDKIDFLVSPTWQRWYASIGLTYDIPDEPRTLNNRQINTSDEIREEIEELKQKIKQLEEKREPRKYNNLEWF